MTTEVISGHVSFRAGLHHTLYIIIIMYRATVQMSLQITRNQYKYKMYMLT